MLFSKKLKSYCNAESGRSMIEMLGVLAIVGVLSIAGIAGYQFAVLKFRANEIINELNARAISISSLLLNSDSDYVPEEVIEDGFGDTMTIGYSVESGISERNSNYFEISVMNVPGDVCVQLLKSYENPIMIFVNGVDYNNDTTICNSDSDTGVEMGFVYRNDLGEHDKCSSKGYFGVDDFQCHCSGNTYIDPDNPLECLCPAGHVWSEVENTCIVSLCPEGYFESLSNGCVPCDDENDYAISTKTQSVQTCKACSNRQYVYQGMCSKKCTATQYAGYLGKCFDCDDISSVGYVTASQCARCENRLFIDNYICIHKDFCDCLTNDNSSFFLKSSESDGPQRTCARCDDPAQKIFIGSSRVSDTITYCNACPNRTVIGKYCVRTTCSSDEFQGKDTGCYSCNEVKSVEINNDTESKNKCLACSQREVTTDNHCRIRECSLPNSMRLDDGTCYSCDFVSGWGKGSITISSDAEQAACRACNRIPFTGCGNPMTCGQNCNKNTFLDNCNWCRSCSDTTPRTLENIPELHDLCYACPSPYNRHVTSGNVCVLNSACKKGTFVDLSGKCISCSITNSIEIGTHPLEQEACDKCADTTPRFWIGSTCYRCDTAEKPVVTIPSEEENCLSCPNMRTINENNECVLIQ